MCIRDRRIVTNSLSVFNLLEAREDCDLCLVGGMYRRRTAAFVGPMAEDTLRALGIDAAYIGANGILDGDVSTSNTVSYTHLDVYKRQVPHGAVPKSSEVIIWFLTSRYFRQTVARTGEIITTPH